MNKEKIKNHFEEHKREYIVGVGVAIITALIMKGVAKRHIGTGIPGTANRVIHVVADRSVVTGNVFSISSRRQGGPSWVIRCLETNKIFESQRAASLGMNIPESDISRHLNGVLEHARGYTFERICIAA